MLRKASSRNELVRRMKPVDQDVATCVEARFRRSGYPYLSGIKCHMSDGTAILWGVVPTFHLKQLAQELALHTLGVRQVDNRVQVPLRRLNRTDGFHSQAIVALDSR